MYVIREEKTAVVGEGKEDTEKMGEGEDPGPEIEKEEKDLGRETGVKEREAADLGQETENGLEGRDREIRRKFAGQDLVRLETEGTERIGKVEGREVEE